MPHSFVSSLPSETSIDTMSSDQKLSNTSHFSSDKILKTSSHFQFHHENMSSTPKTSTSPTSHVATINPFSYLDFTSYEETTNVFNPVSCLDHQHLTNLFLATQETQPQFPRLASPNESPSFLVNMSSSDCALLGECTSQIDLSVMLAQEQCPALVSLPQEYQEKGLEGNGEIKNLGGCNEDYHYQDVKHNMTLLESYYSSLSNGELANCFSTTWLMWVDFMSLPSCLGFLS